MIVSYLHQLASMMTQRSSAKVNVFAMSIELCTKDYLALQKELLEVYGFDNNFSINSSSNFTVRFDGKEFTVYKNDKL